VSRVQSNFQLPQIGLTPVAQPTQQFGAPEVRGTTAGSRLMQVGKALQQIAPGIQNVLDRQWSAETEGQKLQAAAEMQRQQINNQQQLKQAVQDGKIPFANNPWVMVHLDEMMGEKVAKDSLSSAYQDYSQDPIQFTDDLQQVQKFYSDRLNQITEGMNVWQRNAAAPVLQAGMQHLLIQHVDQRREQLPKEWAMGFDDSVSSAIDTTYTGNPLIGKLAVGATTQTPMDGLAASVRSQMDRAGKVLDWTNVNKLAVDSIVEKAEQHGDYHLAEELMNRINTNGNSKLGDTAYAKSKLDDLNTKLVARDYALFSKQEQMRKAESERVTSALLADAGQKWDQVFAKSPTSSLEDIKYGFGDVDKMILDPETKIGVKQGLLKMVKESRELSDESDKATVASTIKNEDVLNIIQGKAGPEVTASVYQMLLKHNGLNDVGNLISDSYHYAENIQRSQRQPMSLDTQVNLAQKEADGTLSPTDVIGLVKQGKLTENQEISSWLSRARDVKGRNDGLYGIEGALHIASDQLEEMVKHGQAQSMGWLPSDILNLDSEKKQQIEDAKVRAKAHLYDAFRQWDTAGQHTQQERIGKVHELMFESSTQNGGLDEAAWNQRNVKVADQQPISEPPKMSTGASEVKPAPDRPAVNTDSVTGIVAKVDPLFSHKITSDNLNTLSAVMKLSSDSTVKPYSPDIGRSSVSTVLFGGLNGKLDPKADLLGRVLNNLAIDRPEYDNGPGFWKGKKVDNVNTAFQQSVVDDYNKAMRYRLQLKQMIADEQVVPSFTSKLNEVQQRMAKGNYTMDPWEKRSLLIQADTLRKYAYYTHFVGYTTDEAKQMGNDAWMAVPMFGNQFDMSQRFGQVAKELGLSQKAAQQFQDRQQEILRNLQNDRTSEFGDL
jgi:hypothetical protein